jgi:putative CocE/NonD family hydrolase
MDADGSLSMPNAATPPPPVSSNVTYTYDPANPVPTLGGNNLEVQPCGPVDQNPVENRSDVLLHTTPPLNDDVYVTGPLKATLYVSSSAIDTDFTAKLTDVYPDGSSHLIQDGILRMRWREGAEDQTFWPSSPSLLTPDEVYCIEVDLWNTSYVFNKGHSIRLAVSSSNSPRFKANPNIGVDISVEDEQQPVVAKNTLHYGGDTASFFELPVVQKTQLPKKIILLDPEHPTPLSPQSELVRSAHKLTQFVVDGIAGKL